MKISRALIKYSAYQLAWTKICELALTKILSKRPNLFLRTKDMHAIPILTKGVHEAHLKELYCRLSSQGYRDFFIDIGANIGLSSILVASEFDSLFLFEPNPLVYKILEVNVSLSAHNNRFTLLNFGLGSEDNTLELVIPKHNWGGGFIVSSDNSLDNSLLAKKDGFNEADFTSNNYFRTEVRIKKTQEELKSIFSVINKRKGRNGVIKIDTEGYEATILKGISSVIPEDFSSVIVFENHNPDLDLEDLLECFNGRAKAFTIKGKSWGKWPKFIKALFLLFGKKIEHYIEPVDVNSDLLGNLVFEIS